MLSIDVRNNGSSPIEFVFPPGTVFQPQESSVQPMLIINDNPRTINPGESKTLCLNTYCLDSMLSPPGSENSFFKGVKGVSSDCLIKILNACSGLELTTTQREKVQDIVWNCTDNGSITPADRAYLDSLQ
jgi:hypothetical protein